MGSKEEEARRIQLLHRHDREGERDGKKASIRRFTRLNVDARPNIMMIADRWPVEFEGDGWEPELQALHRHLRAEDWGPDRPTDSFILILAEALHWALHVERVREDTQTQLNNYEAAALRTQTEGLLDA